MFVSRHILIALFLAISVSSACFAMPSTGSVDVFFSPKGGATEAVVREIDNAKQEVLVQAYSFTSKPIAKAILEAKKRGVEVVAVLDKSQRKERYTEATFISNAGCLVLIDDRHAIAHNKVIIIDRSTLITGSFNFTKAAEEKNAENLLVIKGNKPLIDKYFLNFDEHKRHSERYTRIP